MSETSIPFHYVQIDEDLCNGCVLCMKACPTKAIRIRHGRVARIEGICIDCGECIWVCPRGAIKVIPAGKDLSTMPRHAIMSVSPVLYSQFGDHVMPNDVLLALRKVFKYVYDQSYTNELCNVATELYLKENRAKEGNTWPLISRSCPVVNRLIAHRFPSLFKHILPIITPREIAAKRLKEGLLLEGISQTEDIGVFHITSCSAERISIKEPMLLQSSYLNGAVGLNDVYPLIKKELKNIDGGTMLHRSSGVGIGWAISGGELSGLDSGSFLAVSGIPQTLRYLEKIEMGLLSDIEYVELRACPGGCVGGSMTVTDRYLAKHTVQRLVRMFGVEKRVKRPEVEAAYQAGWFFSAKKKLPPEDEPGRLSVAEAIKRQKQVEETLQLLPKKECGACGSPDCRTFAEDVVDGTNSLKNCVFKSEYRPP